VLWWEKIYVLNLKRREEKWHRTREEIEKHGIDQIGGLPNSPESRKVPVVRFLATDGNMVIKLGQNERIHDLLRHGVLDNMCYLSERKISNGKLGNLFTFRRVMEDALAHGHERVLVLEDDVMFKDNFHQLYMDNYREMVREAQKRNQPVEPDMLLLGLARHNDGYDYWNDRVAVATGYPGYGAFMGAFGNVYNRKAMHHFLQISLPWAYPSDILMGFLCSAPQGNVAPFKARMEKRGIKSKLHCMTFRNPMLVDYTTFVSDTEVSAHFSAGSLGIDCTNKTLNYV
jgi:GR25 family glycosyltransferase involved in LPS biosynthesis